MGYAASTSTIRTRGVGSGWLHQSRTGAYTRGVLKLLKLHQRVGELEESLLRIEKAFKSLEIEWTETYDKFRHLHWRVAKRVKQLEASESEHEGVEAEEESPPGPSGLNPAQMRFQSLILQRRKKIAI